MPTEEPAQPSFEDSLQKLENIVAALEDGRLGLDASLAQFETGVRLIRECQALLEKAEQRIELLTSSDSNALSLEPFDATATFDDRTSQRPARRRTAKPLPEERTGDPRLFS